MRVELRLSLHRAQLVDHQPVRAVETVRRAGLPRDPRGQRTARPLGHERRHRLRLVIPPVGVVAGLRPGAEVQEDASVLEEPHERNDRRRRIEPVAAAVDDEEGLVAQVRDVQVGVHFGRGVGEDHRMPDQQDEAGPRRGRRHRLVVAAGRAVGDAQHVDAVLVDVVRPLQVVHHAEQVLGLALLPPQRLGPRERRHDDGVVARQAFLAAPPASVVALRP